MYGTRESQRLRFEAASGKSGQDLRYTDPDDATKKFRPYVVEPAFGCTRTVLVLLLEAFTEEKVKDDTRTVMKFHKRIAPIDVAILPLSKKEHLVAKAQELYKKIVHETKLVVDFDVTGSIGKRYRRQDEIGTPLCITVDFPARSVKTLHRERPIR